MDKITKALQKLNSKEKIQVRKILVLIKNNAYFGLDIKRLRGNQDIFRIRKGNIRIIFKKDQNKKIFVLAIERRSEKTYKKF